MRAGLFLRRYLEGREMYSSYWSICSGEYADAILECVDLEKCSYLD